MKNEKPFEQKALALTFVGGIGLLLLYVAYNFLSVFVGALILFTLFNPLYCKMVADWKWKKPLASISIIILVLFIVILPLIMIGSLAVQEVIHISSNQEGLISQFDSSINDIDNRFPELNVKSQVEEISANAAAFLQSLVRPIIENATSFLINTIMLFFVLYFMFTDRKKWRDWAYNILPFQKKNSKKIIQEFEKVTKATVISSGIIALIQGVMVGFGMWLAGFENVFIWSIVTTLLAFLPVVGPPFVWIPATLMLVAQEKVGIAIAFFLFCFFIVGTIDNILRPILNKRFGNIHPLVSFVGVFFGLYMFGIIGIILGPLLISYFFLTVKMYREEYIDA